MSRTPNFHEFSSRGDVGDCWVRSSFIESGVSGIDYLGLGEASLVCFFFDSSESNVKQTDV